MLKAEDVPEKDELRYQSHFRGSKAAMNAARALTTVARRAPQLTTTAVAPARKYRTLAQIKELQKQFSKDDGVPVYLKGGPMDKIMYQFTLGLTCVTLGMCFYNMYHLIYRQAK